MLAATGIQMARRAFLWDLTEPRRGIYDFSPYDRLLKALEAYKIRPLFTLSFGNPLYHPGLSPNTPEARKAFVQWALAAVEHFQGRGIAWEMWNEPNHPVFWQPKPDVQQYIALALEVGKALKEKFPQESFVGPATSHLPPDFLKKTCRAGLLQYFDAITVHPYRWRMPPETWTLELERLRKWLARDTPAGKRLPVWVGEWGYPSQTVRGLDESKQGKFLARMWLTDLANDVPVSIWHDWRDDGENPKDPEHSFGIIRHPYHAGREPPFDAKPAYHAAKTLISSLQGFSFDRRLPGFGARNYVLLFRKGSEIRLAAWTTSPQEQTVKIPTGPASFSRVSFTGGALPAMQVRGKYLELPLRDGPQYLTPDTETPALLRR